MALIGAEKLGQLLVLGCQDHGGAGNRIVSREWADKVLHGLTEMDFIAETVKGSRNDARDDKLANNENR